MTQVKLPRIVDHKNYGALLARVRRLPCMQPGPNAARAERPAWIDAPVTLEFPTGELCRNAVLALALVGPARDYELTDLDGSERFNAQGLEGKVRVRKPLLAALLNLNLLPEHRGRVLTR